MVILTPRQMHHLLAYNYARQIGAAAQRPPSCSGLQAALRGEVVGVVVVGEVVGVVVVGEVVGEVVR